MNRLRVTHRCITLLTSTGDANDFCNEGRTACGARRWSNGKITGARCGEPCGWIMGKSGYGQPPWENKDGLRTNPTEPDAP